MINWNELLFGGKVDFSKRRSMKRIVGGVVAIGAGTASTALLSACGCDKSSCNPPVTPDIIFYPQSSGPEQRQITAVPAEATSVPVPTGPYRSELQHAQETSIPQTNEESIGPGCVIKRSADGVNRLDQSTCPHK